MTDRIEPSAGELRALLAAVLEAVDIPHAATVGDGEVHDRILLDRVMDARVALEGVLRRGDDPGWSADYLRARLSEKPATGYRAAGQPRPRIDEPLYGGDAERFVSDAYDSIALADFDDDQDDEDHASDEHEREAAAVQRSVDAQFPAEERTQADRTTVDMRTEAGAVEVERWNTAHPVGTQVKAYPLTRDDDGLMTRTRSEAWLLGGHTPVVLVDGYSGGIALSHIDVVTHAERGEGR
ncbi:hypothetical protein [Streptomyces sp. UG1]|uniref:hypothetical protein n=1 Tax=Streptomyces sp. UG1 TaxID=3417652 RepID=UPI003CFB1695